MSLQDTIFAVSSGSGRAGIAVIRMSGPLATAVAENLTGRLPEVRRVGLRDLKDPASGEIFDRCLVVWFAGPKSATGDDLVEFHLHGSPAGVAGVLKLLGRQEGCRLAEPGEFTRRGFENGRFDLVEIEGLADLLAAETDGQRRLAMRQFLGEASGVYQGWHARILKALAVLEASIDFADEDGVAEAAMLQVIPSLRGMVAELEDALKASERAAEVRRGLHVVIAGEPNVGKSSLLNALTGRDVAITSPEAGTTRDVVEASVVVGGLPVSIADTAGIRGEGFGAVEGEGIRRARLRAIEADILIWVTAAGDERSVEPPRIPDVRVVNKCDLVGDESIHQRNGTDDLRGESYRVSCRTGAGCDCLLKGLGEMIAARQQVAPDAVMVRARHQQAVLLAVAHLRLALSCAETGGQLELVSEDVRQAASALSGITGRIATDDVLGAIFSEFCIGK